MDQNQEITLMEYCVQQFQKSELRETALLEGHAELLKFVQNMAEKQAQTAKVLENICTFLSKQAQPARDLTPEEIEARRIEEQIKQANDKIALLRGKRTNGHAHQIAVPAKSDGSTLNFVKEPPEQPGRMYIGGFQNESEFNKLMQ